MKQLLFSTLVLLIAGQAQAQSLSEILWDRVNACYVNFEDFNEDGIPEFDKVDDAKNGYLQISGSWPTCGCSCRSTVGAFKNSAGEYIFLQSDQSSCDWKRVLSSNRPLDQILPPNFGINAFAGAPITEKLAYPAFFIDLEIPHYGTDTKASIELVPFGIIPEGQSNFCFAYQQQKAPKLLSSLATLVKELSEEQSLGYILEGEFKNLAPQDEACMQKYIGQDALHFQSQEELRQHLLNLQQIYRIYAQLDAFEIILGWNRSESRFYIKEKIKTSNTMTFKQFLMNGTYWGWIC